MKICMFLRKVKYELNKTYLVKYVRVCGKLRLKLLILGKDSCFLPCFT
jgi:hypothetical protein